MRTLRLSLLLGLALLAASWRVPVAQARDATVTTQDGRQLSGEIISEDDKTITLKIASISTPFDKSTLRDIKRLATLAEQYTEKRAALKNDDLEGRFKLVHWLYDNPGARTPPERAEVLELARRELEDLVAHFPDDGRVSQLLVIVQSRIKMLQEQAKQAEPVKPEPTKPEPGEPLKKARGPAGDLPTQMLNEDQINMIRVYEVDIDAKPRVTVPREVRQQVLKDYSDNQEVPKGAREQNKFLAAPDWQALDLLFKLHARQFYPKVKIHEDPAALRAFKVNVHQRYVVNYCATAQCHGGPNAGDLFLFRTQPTSDPTVYTNFYILQHYRGSQGDLIRHDEPDRSLLLQYGLPAAEARTPHPGLDDLRGWHPAFSNTDDPDFRKIAEWIKGIYSSAADYGLDYQVPHLPRAQTPATKPKPAANTPANSPATIPGK